MTDSSSGKGGANMQVGFNTPFQEQIDYLVQKLRLPTERWDDIQRSAHDRAFVVAGAAKADLLKDLHDAVVQRATDGKGLKAFQKDFKAIVAKHGWTGWTGEGTKAGEAWRTKVIYQTNMAQSYAAGRYRQMTDPDYVRLRPYWRYIHREGVRHPRPQHMAWHGLTLSHDHPFWQSHYPPNGWGCGCRIVPVSKAEGERSRDAGLGDSPDGCDAPDPKTGAPVGIDKGFDYAPGAGTKASLQSLIDTKLLNLDAPLGAQVWEVLKPALQQERLAQWHAVFDATRDEMRAGAQAVAVHTVAPATVAALAEQNVILENAAVWMRDTELMHALRDSKAARGAALPESAWRDLPVHLAQATVYLDTQDGSLMYVVELGAKLGKFAVRVNYNAKGRFDGVRARIVSNFVQTGGLVEKNNIHTGTQYVPLKK